MRYSDAELEALLRDTESEHAERKESWAGDAPTKGREAVCAFANDLADRRCPGVLFVGARDDGSPSGLPISDQLLLTLSDIKTDGQILPPPTLGVEKRILRGAAMAVVTVVPADAPPVSYRGRIWIRIGPRRGIATVQDERILNEKRRARDVPFDVSGLPGCPLGSLSRVLFEQEYLPNAVAPELLEANERSYEQRLSACRMIVGVDKPEPTVVGQLALGTSPRDWIPGAYVQFLRIKGTSLSDDIADEADLDGPLSQVLLRLDDKLSAHNAVAVDVVSGSRETRLSEYPLAALQQLCRNAVMHRTYEHTNAPVRVTWFDDRIEILNPGGPFGVVTMENFGNPGVTDYRNPHIADAMKVLGFVQKFGVGIATARAQLQANGNPPMTFVLQPSHVLAIVTRRS